MNDQAPGKRGAFSKLTAAVQNAAAEKMSAREEISRKRAEDAQAAGGLVTSGVFGTSSVEIYENGYVRVASWTDAAGSTDPKKIDKNTPYERLRSIKFTASEVQTSGPPSALEGAVGPAVARLMKGGAGLMKASAPGMAMAGIAHLTANAARKSFLTIATDKQIHTLTNQSSNSVGLKTSNKGHDDVGRALEAAGEAVLGVVAVEPQPGVEAPAAVASPGPGANPQPASATTLSSRLRELADLHKEGILSEEEFAASKAKLLGGL
jgi:hypothetical protein